MREGERKESWMEAEVREGELVEKEREEKEREKKVRWRRGREKTRASLGCTRTGATQHCLSRWSKEQVQLKHCLSRWSVCHTTKQET